MSSALLNAVPILDGTNYPRWSELMKAYLRSQRLWSVVDGDYLIPVESDFTSPTAPAASAPPVAPQSGEGSGTTTSAQAPAASASAASISSALELRKAIRDWKDADDAANGAIRLRIKDSLQTFMADSSKETWDDLADEFGKPSLALKFSWFCELQEFRIHADANPAKDLARFDDLVAKLEGGEIIVPDIILAMFLIRAIPKRLEAVSAILNMGARENEIKIDAIKKAVIAEWERLAKPKALAQRITAVKPHGKPPKFFQQQQPPPSTSKSQPQAPQTNEKKKRFGRGKGGKWKSKAKGHSHATLGDVSLPMAYPSFGFADPEHQDYSAQFVPQITIPLPQLNPEFRTQDPRPRPPPRTSNSIIQISGNGTTTRQAAENLPAQAHTSHTRPSLASFWPSFNKAREVCDRLELPKNQRNLKALETLALQKTDSQVMETVTKVIPEKDDDAVSLGSADEEVGSLKRPNSEEDEGSPPKRVKPLSWADQVDAAMFADDAAGEDDMISLFGEEVSLYDGSVEKAPSGLYSNMDAFSDEIDEMMGPYDPRLEDEYQCESIGGRLP